MNGSEQRKHTRATDELARSIEEIAGLACQRMQVIEDGSVALDRTLRAAIGEERTHRLKLADEQRRYVDLRDRELRDCCQERWDSASATHKTLGDRHQTFVSRGFWSRLNWFLTGR